MNLSKSENSPNEKQIETLQARQATYSDCTDLLIAALNDYADLVGVEGFSLCSSYSRTAEIICFLENHGQEPEGAIFESQNERAIAVFLGMIAQAKATTKKE